MLLLVACASTSVKANTPPAPSTGKPLTMDQVLDRVISNEQDLYDQMCNYSPLVETYMAAVTLRQPTLNQCDTESLRDIRVIPKVLAFEVD